MESKVFTADYLIPEYYAKSHNTYLFLYTGTYVVSHEFAYVKQCNRLNWKREFELALQSPGHSSTKKHLIKSNSFSFDEKDIKKNKMSGIPEVQIINDGIVLL